MNHVVACRVCDNVCHHVRLRRVCLFLEQNRIKKIEQLRSAGDPRKWPGHASLLPLELSLLQQFAKCALSIVMCINGLVRRYILRGRRADRWMKPPTVRDPGEGLHSVPLIVHCCVFGGAGSHDSYAQMRSQTWRAA